MIKKGIVLFQERHMIHEWSYSPSSQVIFQYSSNIIGICFVDAKNSTYVIVNYGSREIFSEVCHNVITITTPSVNSINQLESFRMKPTTYRISNILN